MPPKLRFFLESTKKITRNLQVISKLPRNQHFNNPIPLSPGGPIPHNMAQTFDGPTTIKRSGSEHRRAVTSLALLERARAWEWVKDPPAGEGQVGQIQHCRAVFLFFPEGRRPR